LRTGRPATSLLLAAGSGAALAFSVPPTDLYFFGWIGLVPLFLALRDPRGSGFGEGFVAGLVFNIGVLYWLALNSGTDLWIATATMLATTLILASGWGWGAWIFCRLRERLGGVAWWIVPFGWTAWEGWLSYLGFNAELGFPWPLLALTQSGFDPILQIMEFTGVWGVSFWVAALNVAVFHVWQGSSRQTKRIAFIAFLALVLIPPIAIFHAASHYRADVPTARVAIVQGDIDPEDKWARGANFSFSVYDSLTRAASAQGVDLAVWPETALPVNLMHQASYRDRLNRLSSDLGIAVITGASDNVRLGEEPHPLNAAFLVKPDSGVVERYAKRQLVPMGERVAFQSIAPSLGKLNFGQAEFLPGPRHTVFSTAVAGGEIRFPALICFESAFSDLTRQFVLRGANCLVTISNDSWYGWSSEPAQIAALSRFRSIETRRAMARASNSGISFISDQLGRTIVQTDLYKPAWAGAVIPLCEEQTFYVRHGDWLLVIVMVVYGLALAAAAVKAGREYN
jgi:apolipoprotein N-acyltransferase